MVADLAGQLQSSQSDTDGAEDPNGAEEGFEPGSGYAAEPAGSSPARLQNKQNMEVRCAFCCGLWLLELTAACPMLLAGRRQNFLAMTAVQHWWTLRTMLLLTAAWPLLPGYGNAVAV